MDNHYTKGSAMAWLILVVIIIILVIVGYFVLAGKNSTSAITSNISSSVPVAVNNVALTQPIKDWSDEAHDSRGNRILLCLNDSEACRTEMKRVSQFSKTDLDYYNSVNGGLATGLINGMGALQYCDDLIEMGPDDWRLPTKDEMLSIYGKVPILTRNSEGLLDGKIGSFHTLDYWTSSVDGIASISVSMQTGLAANSSDSTFYAVRCVR